MNIKETLENYNIYRLKIAIQEKEIEELKEKLYNLQALKLDGMPKTTGYTKSKLEEMIVKTETQVGEKEKYINKLKNDLRIIDELIRTLKKYNQDIIKMRYIQKMSIEEIANKKNRDYRTITRTIKKSVNKMQKECNI